MTKLKKSDLVPYEKYKDLQQKFLQEVIEEKGKRRVQISEKISGLFESKLTVFYQIQEMIRAEQISDEDYIQEMLDVYNELLPEENELSMTLFIEVPNQDELRKFNKTIIGIEKNIELIFANQTITSYEPDDSIEEADEDYTQSMHYLHFPFSQEAKKQFLSFDGDVELRVNHSNYKAEAILSKVTVDDLKKQLNNG